MATISENLQTIKTSTDAIKQAIINKGGEISGNITTWADAISAIKSGGITLLGGIKNKLNGSNIAIPTGAIDGDLLYEYQYENLDTTTYSNVNIFMPHYIETLPLPIVNMRFVKDNVEIDSMKLRKLMHAGFKHDDIKWYNVLKLQYNNDKSIEDTIKYIEECKRLRKNLDDFDDNKEIIKNIQDTEVGWIDREGKSYGIKLYMPGQNSHIILADKICKELNIQTDNPSRYLEKEGWLKYTTDFVLISDDMEINDNQLESLRKFLKTPNKLKKEGKIRIGDYMSPYVDISEFDTMDKYSFTSYTALK